MSDTQPQGALGPAYQPMKIEQAGPAELRIVWQDGHESVYPVRRLRLACMCAHCIDEHTREKLLDDDSVPGDVHPQSIRGVGRYALQFSWSDGHDTGIYSFEHLRSLCPCCQS